MSEVNNFEICFVNSTAISYIAYNKDTSVMRVCFNHKYSTYDYSEISYNDYESLITSDSVGKEFYVRRSNPKYSKFVKLEQNRANAFLNECIKAALGHKVYVTETVEDVVL